MKKQTFDIFISYSDRDADFSNRLFKELTTADFNVWQDKEYLHRNPSANYRELIHKGIEDSTYFLLIYSDRVAEEPKFIVSEELNYALNQKKKILVYPYGAINKDIIPKAIKDLRNTQWLSTQKNAESIMHLQEIIMDEKKRLELDKSIHGITQYFNQSDDIDLFLIRVAFQQLFNRATPYGSYYKLCHADNVYLPESMKITVVNKSLKIEIPQDCQDKLFRDKFVQGKNKDAKKEEIAKLLKEIQPESHSLLEEMKSFIIENYSWTEIFDWMKTHDYEVPFPTDAKDMNFESFISSVSHHTADKLAEAVKDKTFFNGDVLGVYSLSDNRTCNTEHHQFDLELYYSDYFTFKCTVEIFHILCSVRDCFEIKRAGDVRKYAPFLCSIGMGGFSCLHYGDEEKLLWIKRSGNISAGDMWHFSFDETLNIGKDAYRKDNQIIIAPDKTTSINPMALFERAFHEENGIPSQLRMPGSGIMEIGLIKSDRLEIEILGVLHARIPTRFSFKEQMQMYLEDAPDGYLEIGKVEYLDMNTIAPFVGNLLTPEAYHLFKRLVTKHLNESSLVESSLWGNNKVHETAQIGSGTIIEEYSRIDAEARIGENCKIHRNVHVCSKVNINVEQL